MTAALQVFAVITAATLLQIATSWLEDTIFTVTVSSQLRGGEQETLCVNIHHPTETICMNVTLYVSSHSILILEEEVEEDFYQCVDFKVPTVSQETVATVTIALDGYYSTVSKDTKILIVPPSVIHIIQADKPVYYPGQTVFFRLVSIDENFIPVKRVYKELVLEDPHSNRIAQWLDKPVDGGILDVSHEIILEALQGNYTITARTDKQEEIHHSFTIKDDVLPKFDVTVEMPDWISLLDREITIKMCGKYTYGRPVVASVKAQFCRKVGVMNRNSGSHLKDICNTYNLETDTDGCATQVVNMADYFSSTYTDHYSYNFKLNAEFEEKGTGVIVHGSGQATFSRIFRRAIFKGLPQAFKPGLTYDGKIELTGPDGKAISNEVVYLSTNYPKKYTLTTDMQGMASFSVDTSHWEGNMYLKASPKKLNETFLETHGPSMAYLPSFHRVTEFYSKSSSFLKLLQLKRKIPCDQRVALRAQYTIQGKELKEGQKVLNFFFLVMSRGGIKQHGSIPVAVKEGIVNKGEVSVPLHKVKNLAPYAQVVLYTVLPNDETVADSMNYPVQLCLNNKVSLKFSSVRHLPAEKTTLSLNAHPGSLCSVRAIDKRFLPLQAKQELTVDHVYSMLSLQKLKGYSNEVSDSDPYPCYFDTPTTTEPQHTSPVTTTSSTRDWIFGYPGTIIYKPPQRKDDSYRMFQEIGLKILTNSDVTKPYKCYIKPDYWNPELPVAFGEMEPDFEKLAGLAKEGENAQDKDKDTLRAVLPETWIWDLIPVGNSGSVKVQKTVPDTITKWVAGAFCVSSVGLGISPNVGLTAFKPFYITLARPYSVIRGEVLTLKATVFNRLSKCIMISVTLAESDKFSFRNCDGCQYSGCLCTGESKTFSWIVTPTALGHVDLRVDARALETKTLCGREAPIVPDKGQIDTVVRKLLVEAEGTPKMEAHNALLCPKGKPVEKKVSLVLPEKFVEGSARASVSVLGDLLGRALKNLENLLGLPYGSGDHNMLQFATNLFILDYLKSTNQLTDAIRAKATHFLESGYQRELLYKHSDGSFSAFGLTSGPGDSWLTSFVMKSFGRAKTYIFVDDKCVTQARAWLSSHQQKDGCIQSVGKLFNNAMKGGVIDEVSLTAYITAALLELDPKKDTLVQNCLKCLKTAVSSPVDDLYTTAVMSYAFTLAGDTEMRNKLITQLHQKSISEGTSHHWEKSPRRRPLSVDVEMTSYVLLALLSGPSLPGFGLDYSAGIVHWLIQQQNPYGGFSSPQDTVVALQALAKYADATYSKESKTTATVTSAEGLVKKFTVDQKNRLLLQEKDLSQVPGEYTVKANGKRCMLVQITMHYNIPPPPHFTTFTISTQVQCLSSDPELTLSVLVRYNGDREETNVVVINIKLLSGHVVDKKSLNLLKSSSLVKQVEEQHGYINIYLNGLKQGERNIYTVKQNKDQPVGNLKPAVVKVYDYNQTDDEAITEYTYSCES